MRDEAPDFLNLEDVLELHALQLARYGGAAGVRDRGLLQSAVAQPQTTFDGAFVHDGLFAMGAAYLFHIVQNHPFVDGNKRVAFQAMYLFLGLNGLRVDASEEEVVAIILSLATGDLHEPSLSAWLRDHVTPR